MAETVAEIAAGIADDLRGTPKSLADALMADGQDEGLADDAEFCLELDGLVFECTTCGWWHELSEMSDTDQVCDECGEEDDE